MYLPVDYCDVDRKYGGVHRRKRRWQQTNDMTWLTESS